MKTYIYQDEKSHKFWAVEQQENELHISWGKVGTNGQSQIKSFADAAAAEKAGVTIEAFVRQSLDKSPYRWLYAAYIVSTATEARDIIDTLTAR